MKQIADDCNNLIWLDHHKTAQPFVDWLQNIIPDKDGIYWIFDNNHSGAGIAWDYFFPNEPRPWIVNYVEDRDLWLNKLWRSEEINAYIACLEFSFDIWDSALAMSIEDAFYAGQVARRKTEQYVREVCKNVYFSDIFGVDTMEGLPVNGMQPIYKEIPTVNICQVDCSEVLHALCEKYPSSPFSMYWMKRADGMYQYGLRSIGDFDVSAVAKLFGGGGHKNAAGFQLNYLLEELK
jgi:oligoribonuclease NrnB/cAMP/cGMP phosphodiesterase (DHH superfamily)